MKYLSLIIVVVVSLYSANLMAADSPKVTKLSPETEALSQTCSREAKNALINGDLALVEKICMQAINDIEKSEVNKEFMVNPIMNLAFSYTLSGLYDKATPLYKQARDIRVELYGPDSKKLKSIDKLIENQEAIKQQKTR